MKFPFQRPGAVFSGLAHVGLLGFILFNLSLCSVEMPVDEVKEAVPVDTISTDAFNKIMAGEKSATDPAKQPVTRADKVAQTVEQHPPTPEPKPQETPPPPPPVPTPPPPPPPPPPPTPEPPPRPDPTPPPPLPPDVPPPAPTPPAPVPPPRDPDAEVIKPAPPKRPDPPKPPPPKPVPEPPEAPKRAEVKPPPKPVKPPPPKPAKPAPDQLAQLADETPDPKPEPRPVRKAVAHPKPAPAEAPAAERAFDPTDISKLLNTEPASAPISTGSKVSKAASRGASSGHDTQMSPNLWDALDGLMQDQYKQCWSYLGLTQTKYIPQIKVAYDADGSLASEPTLINRPSDPALRSLAESALRAVKQCNPLKIPPQFAPYYEEWRARVLRFDPAEMSG